MFLSVPRKAPNARHGGRGSSSKSWKSRSRQSETCRCRHPRGASSMVGQQTTAVGPGDRVTQQRLSEPAQHEGAYMGTRATRVPRRVVRKVVCHVSPNGRCTTPGIPSRCCDDGRGTRTCLPRHSWMFFVEGPSNCFPCRTPRHSRETKRQSTGPARALCQSGGRGGEGGVQKFTGSGIRTTAPGPIGRSTAEGGPVYLAATLAPSCQGQPVALSGTEQPAANSLPEAANARGTPVRGASSRAQGQVAVFPNIPTPDPLVSFVGSQKSPGARGQKTPPRRADSRPPVPRDNFVLPASFCLMPAPSVLCTGQMR